MVCVPVSLIYLCFFSVVTLAKEDSGDGTHLEEMPTPSAFIFPLNLFPPFKRTQRRMPPTHKIPNTRHRRTRFQPGKTKPIILDRSKKEGDFEFYRVGTTLNFEEPPSRIRERNQLDPHPFDRHSDSLPLDPRGLREDDLEDFQGSFRPLDDIYSSSLDQVMRQKIADQSATRVDGYGDQSGRDDPNEAASLGVLWRSFLDRREKKKKPKGYRYLSLDEILYPAVQPNAKPAAKYSQTGYTYPAKPLPTLQNNVYPRSYGKNLRHRKKINWDTVQNWTPKHSSNPTPTEPLAVRPRENTILRSKTPTVSYPEDPSNQYSVIPPKPRPLDTLNSYIEKPIEQWNGDNEEAVNLHEIAGPPYNDKIPDNLTLVTFHPDGTRTYSTHDGNSLQNGPVQNIHRIDTFHEDIEDPFIDEDLFGKRYDYPLVKKDKGIDNHPNLKNHRMDNHEQSFPKSSVKRSRRVNFPGTFERGTDDEPAVNFHASPQLIETEDEQVLEENPVWFYSRSQIVPETRRKSRTKPSRKVIFSRRSSASKLATIRTNPGRKPSARLRRKRWRITPTLTSFSNLYHKDQISPR